MKILRSTLLLILIVATIVGVILYYKGQPILDTLLKTDLYLAAIVMLLTIPYIALAGWIFEILSRIYTIRIHWIDWLGLSFIANFINQLLPYRPGMVLRYVYLQQHYRMTLTQYSTIMFIYFLIFLLCALLFFGIGLFFIHLPKEFYTAFYASIGILMISILVYFFLKKPLKLHNFMRHPFLLLGAFFALFAMQSTGALSLYYAFHALHVSFSYLDCIFMTGLLCITMILPITPGNIGILETLLGTLTHLMVNDFTIGFTAMALLRACQWVVVLIFGVFFSLKLIGKTIPRISTLIDIGDKTNFS